jgi:hypothetical protein
MGTAYSPLRRFGCAQETLKEPPSMIRKILIASAAIALISVAACKKEQAAEPATEATPPVTAEPATAPAAAPPAATTDAAPAAAPAGSMSGSMTGAAPAAATPEKK